MTSHFPKRRRRTPEEARREILDGAEQLLLSAGAERLKLTDIASAAGMSHATLLHHFGSIGDIQSALVTRMSDRLLAEVSRLIEESDPDAIIAPQLIAQSFDLFARPENAKLIAWLAYAPNIRLDPKIGERITGLANAFEKRFVATGRGDIATPQLLLGAITLPMFAAIGEAISRAVGPDDVLASIPHGQVREWITEIILQKVKASPEQF